MNAQASTLAECAMLAYCPQEKAHKVLTEYMGFPHVEFIDHENTQALIAVNDSVCVLAFRGTEADNLEDWATDLKCLQAEGHFGKVHRGFYKAYLGVAKKIRRIVRRHTGLTSLNRELHITGHSLGGALANLCVMDLARYDIIDRISKRPFLATFGAPRVGNYKAAQSIEVYADIERYVNCTDIVPRCPYILYRHAGKPIYIDRLGNVNNRSTILTRALDRVSRHLKDIGSLGGTGIKDHSIARYYLAISKAAKYEGYLPLCCYTDRDCRI